MMQTKATETPITVHVDRVELGGTLSIPAGASGVVIFAHGSGSSRFSPRNVSVAQSLMNQGCATYLFDLLDPNEAQNRANVFDIQLLAERMLAATRTVREAPAVRDLPIGYFGASTGAAAALVAAAELKDEVTAVVSRGGRPDLAGPALRHVSAPTLLLVGSLDFGVIELNEQARDAIRSAGAECLLSIIDGASHLFEEPGTLEEVSRQAGAWFVRHFAHAPNRA